MNPHEEVQQGYLAKQLLENEVFKSAFENVRVGIYEKWKSCPVRDVQGQHELKLMDKLLGELEGYIKQVVDTGKMAEIQLENERKLQLVRKAGIR
jgi:hypothetical protein